MQSVALKAHTRKMWTSTVVRSAAFEQRSTAELVTLVGTLDDYLVNAVITEDSLHSPDNYVITLFSTLSLYRNRQFKNTLSHSVKRNIVMSVFWPSDAATFLLPRLFESYVTWEFPDFLVFFLRRFSWNNQGICNANAINELGISFRGWTVV